MKQLKYWIKERINPQLGTYYVACGQMTKSNAKARGRALYGENIMHQFDTKEAYLARLDDLFDKGESVYR
jgi:hypothetical protein